MPTLVFGGTFDPPHVAHLLLAECARVELGAETVLWMPAGDPYRKAPGTARSTAAPSPSQHRLAMTGLAIADNPAFRLDDRECRRAGPSYSVDTLDELRHEGHDDVVFLFGTDAVVDMPNWKEPLRLLAGARVALAEKDAAWREALPPEFLAALAPRLHVISTMPRLPVSSTLVRERVRAHLPIRYLVPAAVADYIVQHGLYA